MRDGIHLSAWLFRPKRPQKLPALFEQRYADISGANTRKNASELAARGFAVAMVNFRGTHKSEGTYVGYRALGWGEKKDGYDVCEWLAAQPWCTGKVGTFGSSQGGFVQNFLAVAQPPHLVAQYMVDTGLSLFQEGYRIGGVTRPGRFKTLADNCRNPSDNQALLAEWDQHPNYDDYWRQEDCSLHFDKMNVPCFTIGSWYDFMCQGSVMSYLGRKSRSPQQLLIGPWLHGRLNKGNKVAEMTYPENAIWPELDHMARWFGHWLKGEATGVMDEPPVRYYVMGAVGEDGAPGNVWRSAQDFPPKTEEMSYYLHPDAQLAATKPTTVSSTSYVSDPARPMSIPGRGFPGAADARKLEEQAEVRTWTSEILQKPVEWTGLVKAEVWLSSSAKDTDIILRVSDVYPDGRSMLLIDYPLRARYREGFDKPRLLTPGEPALLKWNIGWTSIIFNQGHRIRVTITSTGAPLYEPNPQTGGPLKHTEAPESGVKAINTIWHSATQASRVIVPLRSEVQ
ncbi:MAG: CocE/NonD family hydrolase [Verrucomicrobiaceae bacterium]|nr:CocE/NonD family hydrolase [Verrucomicrobiaceae bacterium]